MLYLPIVLLALYGAINSVQSQCTLPSSLVGTWEGGTHGNITFTNTTMTGYDVDTNTGLVFDCHLNDGEYYVMRSNNFTVIGGANVVNALVCLRLTEISSDSYYYFVTTSELANTNEVRAQYVIASKNDVTVSGACDDTAVESTIQNLKILIKYGAATSAKQQCPDVILGQYWYYSGTTCTESFWDVCSDNTNMAFNYTQCATKQAFSAAGSVYCVYSNVTSSDVTLLYVINTDSTVDGSTTFRYTCMVMTQTGSLVYVSQSPDECHSNQTSTYTVGSGTTITLSPNITCIPSTSSDSGATAAVETSSASLVAGVVVALLLLLIGAAVAGYFIYIKKFKKVNPNAPAPDATELPHKDNLSINVKSDDGRETVTPSVLQINSSHGKSDDVKLAETESSPNPACDDSLLTARSNKLPPLSMGENTVQMQPVSTELQSPLPAIV